MSQQRSFNYREDDSTFLLNRHHLGILEPAVYRGFDNVTRNPDWSLILEHGPTGFQPTALDTSQKGRVQGILLTKQGTVIIEDEPIALVIQPASLTQNRVDLVVCTHQHVLTEKGTTAFYRVITGTPGAGTPLLAQPGRQTIVGTLRVPAGAADMTNTGITWTKNTAELGGRPAYKLPYTVAFWNRTQTWELPQYFAGLGLRYGLDGTTGNGVLVDEGVMTLPPEKGTLFEVTAGGDLTKLNASARLGEVFYLHFTAAARLVRGASTVSGSMLLATAEVFVNPGDGVWFYALPDGSCLPLQFHFTDTARLSQVNRYTRTQQQSKGKATIETLAKENYPGIAKVTLPDSGNFYALTIPTGMSLQVAYMTSMPEGTEIKLVTRQASRLPFDSARPLAEPDWGFSAQPPGGGLVLKGYHPLAFPKPEDGGYVGAQSAEPTIFTFVSLDNTWLLTNTSSTLAVHQHDRQLLLLEPIPGGPGYLQYPANGQASGLLHTYSTPLNRGKRDYLVTQTMSVSLPSYMNFKISYYRNGLLVNQYPTFLNNYQNNTDVITSHFLFQGVLPGEELSVKLDFNTGASSGQLRVFKSVCSLDGTPSFLI